MSSHAPGARSEKWWQDDGSEGRGPNWAEGGPAATEMDDAFGESCGTASRPGR